MSTLFVLGAGDKSVPLASGLKARSAVPNAMFAELRDAGHIPHDERPIEFSYAVACLTSGGPKPIDGVIWH